MPPVRKDGKWVPWEEVYGPLPDLPPRPIKRYKNPKPIDPEAQWVGVKRRLAPWLTEEELRAKPATTPALEAAKRRAAMKSGFVPKVNPIELREETKKRAEKQRKAAEAYQEPSSEGVEAEMTKRMVTNRRCILPESILIPQVLRVTNYG